MSDRIGRLEDNLVTLEKLRSLPTRDIAWHWALRYGLLESIQIVIDLACELVATRNLGSPASYRECVEILTNNALLSPELGAKVMAMIGLRNRLVHDYDEIDSARLIPLLDQLSDFRDFAAAYLQATA